MREPREIWVNEYDNGLSIVFLSREEAEQHRLHGRTALIRFVEMERIPEERKGG